MSASLGDIAKEKCLQGSFLWKWFPGDIPARNFCMSSPAMRRVIVDAWGNKDKKDPPAAGKKQQGFRSSLPRESLRDLGGDF